ncbi:MAG: alpha/beta hydrolase fold domain-containing protein [Spirochaetales bacterium]|nr:alpha/beta hydrolase fold domain-containing protein [Spirochaetales bacterium]
MSLDDEIVKMGLRLTLMKKLFTRQIMHPSRKNKGVTSKMLRAKLDDESYSVEETSIDGFEITTSRRKDSTNNRHLIFLHGGAYVVDASPLHRDLIVNFVKKADLTVTFIDYPKAPENDWKMCHRIVFDAYQKLAADFTEDEFMLFGDSAGGGLALCLLQMIKKAGNLSRPSKSVLFSPWLDLSCQNPDVVHYLAKDPILELDTLIHAAKLFANGTDLMDSQISPLYGDLNNLGELLLFVGTCEICFPDCELFVEKVKSCTGTTVETVIGQGMIHDWIITKTSSAKKAEEKCLEFFQKK